MPNLFLHGRTFMNDSYSEMLNGSFRFLKLVQLASDSAVPTSTDLSTRLRANELGESTVVVAIHVWHSSKQRLLRTTPFCVCRPSALRKRNLHICCIVTVVALIAAVTAVAAAVLFVSVACQLWWGVAGWFWVYFFFCATLDSCLSKRWMSHVNLNSCVRSTNKGNL